MKTGISTVIPTFNRENFIKQAIDHVLQQTVPSDEIIVVDDGSTDGTREVVLELQRRHEQIVYLWQPNAGEASARNVGLSAARHPIVAFLDSDDTWEPCHLEDALKFFAAFPDVGIVFAKYELDDPLQQIDSAELGEKYRRRDRPKEIALKIVEDFYRLDSEECFKLTMNGEIGFSNSTLILNLPRMERNFRFDENLRIGVDVDFRLQLLCSNTGFGYIDKVHSKYLIHDANQISSRLDSDRKRLEKTLSIIKHEEKKLMYCRDLDHYNALHHRLSQSYRIVAGMYCSIRQYEEGSKWYRLSLKSEYSFEAAKHVLLCQLLGLKMYKSLHGMVAAIKN